MLQKQEMPLTDIVTTD